MTPNNKKYLIVGGVAGGATAAARIRRLTEDAEIICKTKNFSNFVLSNSH